MLFLVAQLGHAVVRVEFDPGIRRWDLSNDLMHAAFGLTGDGKFGLQEIGTLDSGSPWTNPEWKVSSPIRLEMDGRSYSGDTPFRLIRQDTADIHLGGKRLTILLQDLASTAQIGIELELFEGQAVLRQRVSIQNLTGKLAYLTSADLFSYAFAAPSDVIDVFHVDQWDPTTTTSFQLHREVLPPEGASVSLRTGADARDIAWFAFRDQNRNGLFAGLEFDGRAQLTLERAGGDGSLRLYANVPGLHHPIEAREVFTLPGAFLGPFQGEWDDAGYQTQRFTEAVLAPPAPLDFPWVSWDSWGYGFDINEGILLENAERAAALGIELFVVDLGWARQIGDWRHDPIRFPRGLRPLSDKVHQLGMRFGLHFALADAAPDSPVLREHPNWTSSETDDYFGAVSLCLSNRETRAWVVAEAVRMIDDYNVDYIVQDGENMVKRCRRADHSHHAQDSNYSNSVDGLNWVVAEIQRLRPRVVWENCEDGGHMMTFQMVQQYVTSITNDASGALDARKGVWGATYPFPARYNSRYMPEHPWSTYFTRSYMFGGPWHFMNRLAEMSAAEAELGAREIEVYKKNRGLIRDGRIVHLMGPPGEGMIDAIESYDAGRDEAIIVAVRDGGGNDHVVLRPQGLEGRRTYLVRYQDDPRVFSLTGAQLAADGIEVRFPSAKSGEIVYLLGLRPEATLPARRR